MNKEERAEKWCRNIPEAQGVDMAQRIRACDKTAWMVALLFLLLFVGEFVLLWMWNDGSVLTWIADTINASMENAHGRNQRRGAVFVAVLVVAPLLILPVAAALLARKPLLRRQLRGAK